MRTKVNLFCILCVFLPLKVCVVSAQEPTDSTTSSDDGTTEVLLPTIYSTSNESLDDTTTATSNDTTTIDGIGSSTEIPDSTAAELVTADQNTTPDEIGDGCPVGYVGHFCETRDLCAGYTNIQNGVCVYSEELHTRYFKCFTGLYLNYTAKLCQNPNPPCFPNPCKRGGKCKVLKDDDFECACSSEYTGKTCETRFQCPLDRQCAGGSCVLDTITNSEVCVCPEGYYFNISHKNCTVNEPPCKPDPCNNNGQCNPGSDDNTFNCTCDQLYTGKYCDIMNTCGINEENCANGQCELHAEAKIQSCRCDDKHYFENGICKEIVPPCFPNPCFRGMCQNTSDESGYNCTCSYGYSGDHCQVRDRCALDGGHVLCNGSVCQMDYERDLLFCNCSDNEYFDYGKRLCKKLNLCPITRCNAHEVCENNKCVCKDGYTQNNETKKCEVDFCSHYGCPGKDMQCKENEKDPKSYECYCKPGDAFNGTHCTPAHCAFPGLNDCTQGCLQGFNDNFTCVCYKDFEYANGICEYTKNDTCENKSCNLGHCIATKTKEKCICPNGYRDKNGQCVDLCTAGKLPKGFCPEDKCVPTNYGYRCQCQGKYKTSDNGVTCAVRKMCSVGEPGYRECSKQRAICNEVFDSPMGYTCTCSLGQTRTEENECRGICDLEVNQKQCDKLQATCSLNESYQLACKCQPPFASSVLGGPCNKLADNSFVVTLPVNADHYIINMPRQSRTSVLKLEPDVRQVEMDVTKSMKQLFEGFVDANVLSCSKPSEGYILCNTYMRFSDTKKEILKRLLLSSACTQDTSGEFCLIPPTLVLRSKQMETQIDVKIPDPCDEYIRSGVCPPETECQSFGRKGFICTCKTGYRAVHRHYVLEESYVEDCRDIDECSDVDVSSTLPCVVSANCVNTMGSYMCVCKPGYSDVNDTTKPNDRGCIELCSPNPCLHGTCAKAGDYTFECSCEAGFSGPLCNYADKNYKDAKMNTVIVGAVLGGILLITLILFVASVTRLRMKKFMEEPNQILYSTEMSERNPVRVSVTNTAFEKD